MFIMVLIMVYSGLSNVAENRWMWKAATKIMHVADSEIGIINGTLFRSRINTFTILESFYCID